MPTKRELEKRNDSVKQATKSTLNIPRKRHFMPRSSSLGRATNGASTMPRPKLKKLNNSGEETKGYRGCISPIEEDGRRKSTSSISSLASTVKSPSLQSSNQSDRIFSAGLSTMSCFIESNETVDILGAESPRDFVERTFSHYKHSQSEDDGENLLEQLYVDELNSKREIVVNSDLSDSDVILESDVEAALALINDDSDKEKEQAMKHENVKKTSRKNSLNVDTSAERLEKSPKRKPVIKVQQISESESDAAVFVNSPLQEVASLGKQKSLLDLNVRRKKRPNSSICKKSPPIVNHDEIAFRTMRRNGRNLDREMQAKREFSTLTRTKNIARKPLNFDINKRNESLNKYHQKIPTQMDSKFDAISKDFAEFWSDFEKEQLPGQIDQKSPVSVAWSRDQYQAPKLEMHLSLIHDIKINFEDKSDTLTISPNSSNDATLGGSSGGNQLLQPELDIIGSNDFSFKLPKQKFSTIDFLGSLFNSSKISTTSKSKLATVIMENEDDIDECKQEVLQDEEDLYEKNVEDQVAILEEKSEPNLVLEKFQDGPKSSSEQALLEVQSDSSMEEESVSVSSTEQEQFVSVPKSSIEQESESESSTEQESELKSSIEQESELESNIEQEINENKPQAILEQELLEHKSEYNSEQDGEWLDILGEYQETAANNALPASGSGVHLDEPCAPPIAQTLTESPLVSNQVEDQSLPLVDLKLDIYMPNPEESLTESSPGSDQTLENSSISTPEQVFELYGVEDEKPKDILSTWVPPPMPKSDSKHQRDYFASIYIFQPDNRPDTSIVPN